MKIEGCKSIDRGIRHRTLLSFALQETDREEAHLTTAFPTLMTCISHKPECQEPVLVGDRS